MNILTFQPEMLKENKYGDWTWNFWSCNTKEHETLPQNRPGCHCQMWQWIRWSKRLSNVIIPMALFTKPFLLSFQLPLVPWKRHQWRRDSGCLVITLGNSGASAVNRPTLTWSSSSADLHFIQNPELLWMRDTFCPSVITVNYWCLLSIFSYLHKLILCLWILSCVNMPWFIIAIVKTVCYETEHSKNCFVCPKINTLSHLVSHLWCVPFLP